MTARRPGDWMGSLQLAFSAPVRRAAGLGFALSFALIVVFYALVVGTESGLPHEDRLFPLGDGARLRLVDLLSGLSFLFLVGVSILMMVPVASVFSWLFLDDLADAADRAETPRLPPARRLGRWEAFVANANFFGLLSALNILALIHVYPVIGLWTPVVFWALNGVLLGKEYTQLVLMRRVPAAQARRIWRRNFGAATLRGTIFAVLLTLPFVNLAAPVLGGLAFSRFGNRLWRGATSG